MKVHRNVALIVALLAFAGLLAGTAKAQETIAEDARFTLPWKAMWGDKNLVPGDYTLSVVKRSGGLGYTVTFARPGIKKTIVAVKHPESAVGNRSMLVAERSGRDVPIIRALHLPYADLVLTFPTSKTKRKLVAKAPETLQSVPILVAAE